MLDSKQCLSFALSSIIILTDILASDGQFVIEPLVQKWDMSAFPPRKYGVRESL